MPRSWIKPVRMNQRGWPSARIASDVCIRCSICVRSVSGSLSSTSVLRNSIASQIPIVALVLAEVLPFFGPHEVERLMAMIQPVELADAGPDVRSIIAERRLLFGLRIALLEKVFPVVETGEAGFARSLPWWFDMRHLPDLLDEIRRSVASADRSHRYLAGPHRISFIGLDAALSLRYGLVIRQWLSLLIDWLAYVYGSIVDSSGSDPPCVIRPNLCLFQGTEVER